MHPIYILIEYAKHIILTGNRYSKISRNYPYSIVNRSRGTVKKNPENTYADQ